MGRDAAESAVTFRFVTFLLRLDRVLRATAEEMLRRGLDTEVEVGLGHLVEPEHLRALAEAPERVEAAGVEAERQLVVGPRVLIPVHSAKRIAREAVRLGGVSLRDR